MKKLLYALIFLSFFALNAQEAAAPSGFGTSGEPYQIATWQNLYWISQNSDKWDKYFIQTGHIDFSTADPAINTWDDGKGWTPIGVDITNSFTGNYNGQGYTIWNLYINRSDRANAGLFGHVGNSSATTEIRNVRLGAVSVIGGRGTGPLAGRVTGNANTRIRRCAALSGTVTGTGATGGLVGSNNSYVESPGNRDHHPQIIECYSHVNVNASGGGDKFGGLTGCNQKGRITNSYALGTVSAAGADRVGGLSGCILIRGYIENSYSAGSVTGTTNTGGFVGRGGTGGSDGDTENCFWDTETSGQATSSPTAGCTCLTTNEMKSQDLSGVWGWDTNIWERVGHNYPRLLNNVDYSLPVDFSCFSAEPVSSGILLKWRTESEVENLGFVLEKSEQGAWRRIASYLTHQALQGSGTCSSPSEYEFLDTDVLPDAVYQYRLSDVSNAGEVNTFPPLTVRTEALPLNTEMDNAYPNPFNPVTFISYRLSENTHVKIAVFDMLGRQIKTLHEGRQNAGAYQVYWNALDENGKNMPSGSYFVRMQTDKASQVQKVVLLK